jgi:hypothetical protein
MLQTAARLPECSSGTPCATVAPPVPCIPPPHPSPRCPRTPCRVIHGPGWRRRGSIALFVYLLSSAPRHSPTDGWHRSSLVMGGVQVRVTSHTPVHGGRRRGGGSGGLGYRGEPSITPPSPPLPPCVSIVAGGGGLATLQSFKVIMRESQYINL